MTNDLESYFRISLSADGRKLIARQQKFILHLWLIKDLDAKSARQLTSGNRNFDGYSGLAFTPDNRIIYTSPMSNVTDLYSINADGNGKIRLTENSGKDNSDPAVSPDGRLIAFTSDRSGSKQIWQMTIDGRNQTQLTFDSDQHEEASSPVFSPDGSETYFLKAAKGETYISKLSTGGGTSENVLKLYEPSREGLLSLSHDGKNIAYRQTYERPDGDEEETTMRIVIQNISTESETKKFDVPIRRAVIHWKGNEEFIYTAGTFNTSSLWSQTLAGSAPKKILDFSDRIYNFAISRSSNDMVVSSGKLHGDIILITNLP